MQSLKYLVCALLISSVSFACSAGESAAPDGAAPDDEQVDDRAHFLTEDQLNGSYLLVVSTVVAARIPVVLLAQIEAERAGDELLLRIRERPLSKLDRATPVGPWSDWMPATLNADGEFVTESLHVVIPAEANAVTGFDTDAEITLSGMLSNPASEESPEAPVDFLCGQLSGRILEPLPIDDLSGSTFTATRLTDVDDPATYPEALINCAGAAARPL
jgi:hypothetical protein